MRLVRAAVRSVLVRLLAGAAFLVPAADLGALVATLRFGAASAGGAACSALALAASFISRDLRRLALRLCSTPCSAALSSAEVATRTISSVPSGASCSTERRALATAVRTAERTLRFCSCLRRAERMRLRAELLLANFSSPRAGAQGADCNLGPCIGQDWQYTKRAGGARWPR